jgi:peptidyl-tRNA hydrolase, PTH1 family
LTKLIVALGNPGLKYENTRHNIGWKVLEHLSFWSDLVWKEKFKGLFAQKNINGEQIIFLMPQTFMNLSGESVRPAMDFFKVEVGDLFVIHDEIDLPYGTIQVKTGGGLAGNNGLKSINQQISTKDFHRLRVGIGRPKHGDVSSHVLGLFNEEEKINLEDLHKLAAEAIEAYLKDGIKKTQNNYSKKSVIQ